MFYIFEDNQNQRLARLFREGYSKDKVNNFIYTNGNGDILNTIDIILNQYGEQTDVVVYLDVVPDNKDTIARYNKILEYLSDKVSHRVIVLPIPCMEYFFLKSIQSQQVEDNKEWIETCVDRQWWRGSSALETPRDIKFCKSFEKFCKLIQIKAVKDCAKQQGNEVQYFRCDCGLDCGYFQERCKHESKDFKCARFLNQLPCVPQGQILKVFSPAVKQLSFEELIKIHRYTVDNYNVQASLYRKTLMQTEYKGFKKLPKKARIGGINYIL